MLETSSSLVLMESGWAWRSRMIGKGALMHALIWKQSGGEPWSFLVPGESLPRLLPRLQDAVREAQGDAP
jgi:hypothetical protein